MSLTFEAWIITVGDSKGVTIPKALLKNLDLTKKHELTIKEVEP